MNDRSPLQTTIPAAAGVVDANQDSAQVLSANATGGSFYSPTFFGYGFSQQGSSHIEGGIPCQDANAVRIVSSKAGQHVITAIADGLGSCVMSHAGSLTAVLTATSHCENALKSSNMLSDQEILAEMKTAFSKAWDAIEEQAMAMNQLPFSFYTTLTLTIYDGEKLHIGHIGDGGVVAMFRSGRIALVTKRNKGDTATSVYPLQSGEDNWQFFTLKEPVIGFAAATDGVLDSFVKSETYGNLVYEPFLTDFLFRYITTEQQAMDAARQMDAFLQSKDFREYVHDDITLFVIGNTGVLRKRKAPVFDQEKWDEKVRAVSAELQARMNQSPSAQTLAQKKSAYPNLLKRLYDYFVGGSITPEKKETPETPDMESNLKSVSQKSKRNKKARIQNESTSRKKR